VIEPVGLPSGGSEGLLEPASGLPLVAGIGLPPNRGSLMPFDTGLVYDPTGGASAAGFGGKWLCGDLAGLSVGGGTAPVAAPVFYRGPNRSIAFDFNAGSGTYATRYFNLQTLAYSAGTSSSSSSGSSSSSSASSGPAYTLLETCGRLTTFSTAGVIRSVAGRCGNVMNYVYGGDGKLSSVDIALESSSNSYAYTWTLDRTKITEVVYSVGVRKVRKLVYAYSGNDLVTIKEFENTAAADDPVAWSGDPVSAVRYSYHSDGSLRHVVGPAQYRQMKVNPSGPDPDTAEAGQLDDYASAEYEYFGGRVSRMYKNGRAYTYDMTYVANSPAAPSLNAWTRRTRVTAPGGVARHYYYNSIGQLMLKQVAESPSSSSWNLPGFSCYIPDEQPSATAPDHDNRIF
jgi:hypothetical protein